MSVPALLRLRQALPGAHIALLTAEKLAGLWAGHEAIDEVITFTKAEGVGQVSRKLRAGHFDTALILPNSFRSAFEAWLAGVPRRVGYKRPWLLTDRVPPRPEHIEMHKRSAAEVKRLTLQQPHKPRDTFPPSAHHLHQYLKLAAYFGASEEPLRPKIAIQDGERTKFVQKFALPRERPIIGLNPGAEYGPAKRWPVERFIEVAKMLNANALVFGGPGDMANADQIARAVPGSLNLAGRTSLRELAVGLSLCDVVVTNDTGPMHLAAAVGARVVVPFGSTSPELTGPGLPGDASHRLLLGAAPCAPCFLRVCPIDLRCMKSIEANAVLHAIQEIMAGRVSPPAPGSA